MKNRVLNVCTSFSIFISCVLPNILSAQNTNESEFPVKDKTVLQCLKKLRQIRSGELHYSVKDKSFFRADTTKGNMKMIFSYRKDEDSFMFDMIHIERKTRNFYDLEKRHWVSETNKNYDSKKSSWQQVDAQINSDNYIPVTSRGKNISNYIKKEDGIIKLKDTVINKERFRVLNIFFAKPHSDTVNFRNMDMYWYFSKKDLLPKKFIFTIEGLGGKQYSAIELSYAKLNHINHKKFVEDMNTAIRYYQANFTPYQHPNALVDTALLPVNSLAPDFKLPELNADSLHLAVAGAKITILDFWYISCYPCQLAVPALVELQKKYADKGLAVIGINPYDKDTAQINKQLRRKNVNYTIVLDDNKRVAKAYHVTAYPTFYVLDKNRKIIYSQKGYGEGFAKKMEEIIEAELNKQSRITEK